MQESTKERFFFLFKFGSSLMRVPELPSRGCGGRRGFVLRVVYFPMLDLLACFDLGDPCRRSYVARPM